MTANVDLNKYRKLLTAVVPMPIKNDDEYERALGQFEKLVDRSLEKSLSPEEDRMFDLLAGLIEKYEDQHFLIETDDISPVETLRFLMNQNDLAQKDLVEVFGSKGVLSEVLAGKRSISTAQAKKLAERFCLSTDLFI